MEFRTRTRFHQEEGIKTKHNGWKMLSNRRSPKPLASISLDLDNQWSYMKTHGEKDWENFPSYLDIFVPKVLDILDRLKLKITFFIVGQDAALDKNREFLKLLIDRGHELGNHSFNHEPWLHLYPKDKMEKEILDTEEKINQIVGKRTIGFRGPGYCWSRDLFDILYQNGYLYDASLLPTFLAPLAKLYYFWKADLDKEEKTKKRKQLFGGFKEGLLPSKSFLWDLNPKGKILEIPVTPIPFFKTPFHFSYLLFLRRYSPFLMWRYLTLAVMLCRLAKISPSFLLHPLDFLDKYLIPEIGYFPGMEIKAEEKVDLLERTIHFLAKSFHLVDMSTHAKNILEANNLKTKYPA